MRKKIKIVISVITILCLVLLIWTSMKHANKSNGEDANLYTIISGWISGIATLIIGILTLWLTCKIDKVSKAKDEQREKELNQQYINQLKMNVNPTIYFGGIENFCFSNHLITISSNEFVNRLVDDKKDKNIITASGYISLELVFKSPKPENVENIYIQNLDFIIKPEDEFGDELRHSFSNYSSNKKANLKYNNKGCLECHTDMLMLQEENAEKILSKINEAIGKNKKVVLIVDMTASNSFGVYKNYRCGFYFKILTKRELEFEKIKYCIEMIDDFMWVEKVSILEDNKK